MPVMNQHLITAILITATMLWAVYRRARRLIGRQPVLPGRLRSRIALLGLVVCLVAAAISRDLPMLAALAGGAVCGAVLSQTGLRLTRFEVTPEGRFYTPNSYLGLAMVALFLGRELYEFLDLNHGTLLAASAASALARPFPNDPLAQSPLSLGILGAVLGYYIAYAVGILQRARSIAAPGQTADTGPQ
jgi:hypothetical protein